MEGTRANASSVLGRDSPPVRVLLVDDDEDYAKYLRRVLGRLYPIDLHVVHDVESARRSLEANQYGLVISDYDLKPGTGLQVLSHARERPGRSLRILMSGNTSLVPQASADAAHYLWDKQWEIELFKVFAEAALRSAARIPGTE